MNLKQLKATKSRTNRVNRFIEFFNKPGTLYGICFLIIILANFKLFFSSDFIFTLGDSGFPVNQEVFQYWSLKRLGLWAPENNGTYYIYATELPVNLLFFLINFLSFKLLSPYLILKITILLSILGGIIGIYKLTEKILENKKIEPLFFLLLTVIYFLNPMVYTKVFMSHVWLILAYCATPLCIYLLAFKNIKTKGFWFGISILPLIFSQIQYVVINFFLIFFVIFAFNNKESIKKLILIPVFFTLFNSFWIIPFLLSNKSEVLRKISMQTMDTFSIHSPTVPQSIVGLGYIFPFFEDVLTEIGFLSAIWQIFFILIQIFLIFGTFKCWSKTRQKRYMAVLAMYFLTHVVLTTLKSPELVRYLAPYLTKIPFILLFREVYNLYVLKYFLILLMGIATMSTFGVRSYASDFKTFIKDKSIISLKYYFLMISLISLFGFPYFMINFRIPSVTQSSQNQYSEVLKTMQRDPGKAMYFPLSSIGKFVETQKYYGRNFNMLNMPQSTVDYSERETSVNSDISNFIYNSITKLPDKNVSEKERNDLIKSMLKALEYLKVKYVIFDESFTSIDPISKTAFDYLIKSDLSNFELTVSKDHITLYKTKDNSDKYKVISAQNNANFTNLTFLQLLDNDIKDEELSTNHIYTNDLHAFEDAVKTSKEINLKYSYFPFINQGKDIISEDEDNFIFKIKQPKIETNIDSEILLDIPGYQLRYELGCAETGNNYLISAKPYGINLKINNEITSPYHEFTYPLVKKDYPAKDISNYKIDFMDNIFTFKSLCIDKQNPTVYGIQDRGNSIKLYTSATPDHQLLDEEWSTVQDCLNTDNTSLKDNGISYEYFKYQKNKRGLALQSRNHIGCITKTPEPLDSDSLYELKVEYEETVPDKTEVCIYDSVKSKCLGNENNDKVGTKEIYFQTNDSNKNSIYIYLRSNSTDGKRNQTKFYNLALRKLTDPKTISGLSSETDLEHFRRKTSPNDDISVIVSKKDLPNLIKNGDFEEGNTYWGEPGDCNAFDERSIKDVGIQLDRVVDGGKTKGALRANDHTACINQLISSEDHFNAYILKINTEKTAGNDPKVCIYSEVTKKCEYSSSEILSADKPIYYTPSKAARDGKITLTLYAQAGKTKQEAPIPTISSYSDISVIKIPDLFNFRVVYSKPSTMPQIATQENVKLKEITESIFQVETKGSKVLTLNYNFSNNWVLFDLEKRVFVNAAHYKLNETGNVWLLPEGSGSKFMLVFLPSVYFYLTFIIYLLILMWAIYRVISIKVVQEFLPNLEINILHRRR